MSQFCFFPSGLQKLLLPNKLNRLFELPFNFLILSQDWKTYTIVSMTVSLPVTVILCFSCVGESENALV